MPFLCPTCGSMFAPRDIDTEGDQATCRACKSVTSLDQLGLPVAETPASPKRHRQAIPCPRHFSVKDDGSSLRIHFCWVWRRFLGVARFCFLWNCWLGVWIWLLVRGPYNPMVCLAAIITIPHVAAALLLLYGTFAGLLNRTVIKVTFELITVWQGPVPWWGNRSLPLDDLDRLYCDKEPDSERRKRLHCYRVNALTKAASKVDLVSDLDRVQALFIHQELERWLTSNKRHRR